jgi:peptidoglycan/xylan/chitin deacetylase (PgdA/CDA1 family)
VGVTRLGHGQLKQRALERIGARRSIVLGYHGVADGRPDHDPFNLRVSPDRFRAQLELLLSAGLRFVTVAELAERVRRQGAGAGLAALSFDDGMQDNHATVLPIVKEYDVPATVYVTTGLIGQPNPWLAPESGARMMSADELRELAAAGIELGAHTVTHPDLSALDRQACLTEMVESKRALERIGGRPVLTFAYPSCRYGPAAVEAARDAGFVAAVTCAGSWTPRLFELTRAMISSRDGLAAFTAKAAGVYEPVFASVPGRALRASTRGVRRRLRDRAESG